VYNARSRNKLSAFTYLTTMQHERKG